MVKEGPPEFTEKPDPRSALGTKEWITDFLTYIAGLSSH